MPTRLVGVLLAVVFLNACQATSQDAGRGPLNLSSSTAGHLENYLANPDGRAIAVSHDGWRANWSTCAHVNCSWNKYGSAEKSAITRCQKGGKRCGIFAIYDDVVWQGPVTLPTLNSNADKVLRLVETRNSGATTVYTGRAIVQNAGKLLDLRVRYKSNFCEGQADIENRKWYLDCRNQPQIGGPLKSGSVSLYWGTAEKSPLELTISDPGWPLLEAKLKARDTTDTARVVPVPRTDAPRQRDALKSLVVTLKWDGTDRALTGKSSRLGNSNNGQMVFFDKDEKEVCSGTFEVWYGTTGQWNVSCSDLGALSGSLRIRDDSFSGKGRDAAGHTLTLTSDG